jgi:predicted small secreted protein
MKRLHVFARLVALALAATLILSACNTVRGVGRDVEKAGEVISDTAD